MVLGIVGSEGKKFTPLTEERARDVIRKQIKLYASHVVSGGCHLGGIDIWAVEEAKQLGIPYTEHKPKSLHWDHYKARNIKIAKDSDIIICITVSDLPPGYKERGFERFCYHCNTDLHIKSGGCWTVKYAKGLGKTGNIITIEGNNDCSRYQVY